MAYTALELITKSFYLSGVVARDLQSVSGSQISYGLDLLNGLLDFKSIQTYSVPYYKTDYSGVFVVGQEKYFVPNLLECESFTYNIDSVRYNCQFTSREDYFSVSRANTINSFPFIWTFNRALGGADIFVYFLPSANYTFNIVGKFGLTDASLSTDLTTVYDNSYIEYLRFALAYYICIENDKTFNPQAKETLDSMMRNIMYISAPDLSLQKVSPLQRGTAINYAIINNGGWVTVS